jgi:transcriptional regulator with XRE-family HTH domain
VKDWQFSPRQIEQRRLALGLTKQQLARQSKIHYRSLLNWLSGSNLPNTDAICRLAHTLCCNPGALFERVSKIVNGIDHRCCSTDPCGEANCPEAA